MLFLYKLINFTVGGFAWGFKQTSCKVDYAFAFYILRFNLMVSPREFKQTNCKVDYAFMFYTLRRKR